MTDAALPAMHILDASDNQSEMSVMHHPTASVTSESETTNSTDCCLELTSSDFNQDGTCPAYIVNISLLYGVCCIELAK